MRLDFWRLWRASFPGLDELGRCSFIWKLDSAVECIIPITFIQRYRCLLPQPRDTASFAPPPIFISLHWRIAECFTWQSPKKSRPRWLKLSGSVFFMTMKDLGWALWPDPYGSYGRCCYSTSKNPFYTRWSVLIAKFSGVGSSSSPSWRHEIALEFWYTLRLAKRSFVGVVR